MEQMSLFEPFYPSGFKLIPGYISAAEEKALLRAIRQLEWQEVRMHGVVAKRRVVHYGLNYTYSSRSVNPTAPPFLQPVLARVIATLRAKKIDEVLISDYPPRAGIGWHRDAPMFSDKTLGISLLSPCAMKLRKPESTRETVTVELKPRDAYLISGEARREWQHHIPPVKAQRYSLTFRTLRK